MLDQEIHVTLEQHEIYCKHVLSLASKSHCKKRKVGAVIVSDNIVLGQGFNHCSVHGDNCTTEDECTKNGNIIHAEDAAIQDWRSDFNTELPADAVMYVTHPPCVNCLIKIQEVGIKHITVVSSFLKFDATKLRYDLIPPIMTKALAEGLTYGAKKYKPNNWKSCTDRDRYVGALMRHIEAHRSGELIDEDSKLPHLALASVNLAFLLYLTFDYDFNLKEENGQDNNQTE